MEDEDCMIRTMELAYTNTDSMERQGGHTHLFQLCDCSWVGGCYCFPHKTKILWWLQSPCCVSKYISVEVTF